MKKAMHCLILCGILALGGWTVGLLADKESLGTELIRLHVVANSDSEEDQAVKLQVRDAVLRSLEEDLREIADVETAKAYLRENLPRIRKTASNALEKAGVDSDVVVSLCREAFDIRQYDTFRLPSGVYDSLRIVIGEGKGQNWWCVAYPGLCLPGTTEDFAVEAVNSGFSEGLTGALTGDEDCTIRFFLLDQLGRLEKILTGS